MDATLTALATGQTNQDTTDLARDLDAVHIGSNSTVKDPADARGADAKQPTNSAVEEEYEEDEDGNRFYDEVEIEDMEYDEATEAYYYPCPCGDKFMITRAELRDGEEIARCPSCTLIIQVIYDPDDFAEEEEDSDSD